MELILINETKLKIMLTREDMKRYELDCDGADYDNTETRRAFWSILDEAKHRTGFDAARDRVFIQLYPSREGGCEMFVTKIGLLGAGGQNCDKSVPDEVAYGFDSLDQLLCCCRMLGGENRNASAYAGERGDWYLLISPSDEAERRELCCILSEFGTAAEAEWLRMYISEHGRQIFGDKAISKLSAL